MKYLFIPFFILTGLFAKAQTIVLIRHGEKPPVGDQLSCSGYNRSVRLPAVLIKKFGVPDAIYVPTVGSGKSTKSARMLETALPLAVKYNLAINSKFDVDDKDGLAANLLKQSGVLLVVWEHSALAGITKKLGIKEQLNWPSDDFDSIWIVTVTNGKVTLRKDKENILPAPGCAF